MALHLLKSGVCVEIICNFAAWEICLFSLIYLSIQLVFLSIWTHSHLFYTLSYNPVLCYLSCSSFGHWENFSVSAWVPLSSCHHYVCVYVCVCVCVCWVCPYFLTLHRVVLLESTLGSKITFMFLTPVQEFAISTRGPDSFYCKRVLETKNWALGMLIVPAGCL
jgi:hypothetical protein